MSDEMKINGCSGLYNDTYHTLSIVLSPLAGEKGSSGQYNDLLNALYEQGKNH